MENVDQHLEGSVQAQAVDVAIEPELMTGADSAEAQAIHGLMQALGEVTDEQAGEGANEFQTLDEDGLDGLHDGNESELSDATEVDETQPPTFVRKPGRGCDHYSRGCRLVSPCCGEQFWCRFCHNAAMDNGNSRTGHSLDRHAVKAVILAYFLVNC
jgi:hypothetical protein